MSRKERDVVMGHAEDNDGIEEYDNPLPDWWLGLFILTVVWGVGYAIDYHLVSDRSQVGVYEAELADAAVRWPVKEVSATLTAADLEAGKAIYDGNCLGCHAANLKGGIGPDLTDAVWIHGGTQEQVIATITVGVPEKGMITWGPILGPQKIAQVAGFILAQSDPNSAEAPAGVTE